MEDGDGTDGDGDASENNFYGLNNETVKLLRRRPHISITAVGRVSILPPLPALIPLQSTMITAKEVFVSDVIDNNHLHHIKKVDRLTQQSIITCTPDVFTFDAVSSSSPTSSSSWKGPQLAAPPSQLLELLSSPPQLLPPPTFSCPPSSGWSSTFSNDEFWMKKYILKVSLNRFRWQLCVHSQTIPVQVPLPAMREGTPEQGRHR
jgi:hypothetical protein